MFFPKYFSYVHCISFFLWFKLWVKYLSEQITDMWTINQLASDLNNEKKEKKLPQVPHRLDNQYDYLLEWTNKQTALTLKTYWEYLVILYVNFMFLYAANIYKYQFSVYICNAAFLKTFFPYILKLTQGF